MSSTETVTAAAPSLSLQGEKVLPKPDSHKLPKVKKVPTFETKEEEREWAKAQMAGAFRVFAKLGFSDGVAGHMSLRDPVDPKLFWINPYAMHFSLIKVSDLVLVDEEGQIQAATPHTVSHAGFIIHSVLHQMRPDVNVAVHLHSPHGVAWSAFGRPVEMLVQDMCYFYDDLSVYEGFGGTVLAKEEGMNLARALGPKNKNIILQNHGILTCGSNVGEAAGFFIALERACQRQLMIEAAAASGIPKRYIPEAEAAYSKKYDYTSENTYMSFQPEYQAILAETRGAFLE
ncbi:class II aldolase/adducin N-terminal [Microdochium trichocladiopsis]|uniref:Class II aldolase/adducin N-terminal n=1 Tax=Microdochium trichocladiopsis TaxID=1682393 RepID=A0A9P8XWY4_9PEZI|nr:class II aldolase/adducin N-terminal [Microdochium trichocladiopsis]KAH7024764.1 class II aldolase/adducin N-terminal [Microdochium trichocladiopsis]